MFIRGAEHPERYAAKLHASATGMADVQASTFAKPCVPICAVPVKRRIYALRSIASAARFSAYSSVNNCIVTAIFDWH
jgi:hypothetical protein